CVEEGAEKPYWAGEIEDAVARRMMLLRGIVQVVSELKIGTGIVDVALDVRHRLRQSRPGDFIDLVQVELRRGVADEALQRLMETIAPILHGALRMIHADQRKILREDLGVCQIVERRHHQALGQIAGSAEDHHDTGVSRSELPRRRCCDPGLACRQRRTDIEHGVILLHLTPPATFAASVRDLLILGPRCDRRNLSASPTAAFLRTYAPGASGSGRRAPTTARRPVPPPRLPPR